MANTAFGHDATLTTPGSTTDTALVRWANTSGTSLNNTINILSDGSNITLNARGEVRFSDADSTHYIAFESPATVTTSYTMTLPADLPAADEVLTVTSYSGGAGVLEWAAAAAGGDFTDGGDTASATMLLGTNNAHPLGFETSGSTRMTIVADGTIGIGTAAPASMYTAGTPTTKSVQIGAANYAPLVMGNWATNYSGYVSNAYFADGWKYVGTGYAMGIRFHGAGTNAGSMLFTVAPNNTGSAGATITNWDGSLISPTTGATTDIKMKIDSSGAVNMPNTPAVSVCNTSLRSNVTGDAVTATVPFDVEFFDQGGDWDGSDTFTAPVFGRYLVLCSIRLTGLTGSETTFYLRIMASNRLWNVASGDLNSDANSQFSQYIYSVIDMDAGDTCYIGCKVGGTSRTVDISGDASSEPRSYVSYLLVA